MKKTACWLLAAWLVACGGGGSNGGGELQWEEVVLDAQGDAAVDALEATPDLAGEEATPTPAEDFRVVFGQQGRIAGVTADEFDLWMVQADGQGLTNFTKDSLAKQELTCQYGCLVDEKLNWIAVSTQPADAGQFTFKLGQINNAYEVFIQKGVVLEDVVDLQFAGDWLFYSKRQEDCKPMRCAYSIWRKDLAQPMDQDDLMGVFPPADAPEYAYSESAYQGHFRVSPDGSSLVVLSPTIRSQRIYMLKDGVLSELDYICDRWNQGSCVGAGSAYGDTDPVAISHDSRWVVVFFKAETEFVAHLYDLQNPTVKRSAVLLSVPKDQGLSIHTDTVACANRQPWQFLEVRGVPRFTRDNMAVVMAGWSECTTADNPRPATNIYMLPIGAIKEGNSVTQAELTSLVQKPTGNEVRNVIIQEFDFSPQGDFIAFAATPMFQANGQTMPITNPRARNDFEIYVLDPATQVYTELTNNQEYSVVGMFTIRPKGL
jgi:hypothetical protein